MTRLLLLSIPVLALAACGDAHTMGDAGPLDASPSTDARVDAAATDGALLDSAVMDALVADASLPDAGVDAAVIDAGGDAGAGDAGATDAGASDAGADAGPVADAGACTMVGDFSFTFMGMTGYFRFAADGSWAGADSRAGLDTPSAYGPYGFDGSTLTLRDEDSSCPISETGTFTVSFAAGCGGLTLTLVSDPCGARGAALDGAHLVRLP